MMNTTKKYQLKMKIKRFKQFEAISGTELVGKHMGPGYPEQDVTNTQISTKETDIIYSEITSQLYTYDDYQNLYNEYLKRGGVPLHGFTKENLDKVLFSNT
jgi:hypothetical protein